MLGNGALACISLAARTTFMIPAAAPKIKNTTIRNGAKPHSRSSAQPMKPPTATPATSSVASLRALPNAAPRAQLAAPPHASPLLPPAAARVSRASDECSQRHGRYARDRTCCRLRPLALLNFRESLGDRLVLKLGAHLRVWPSGLSRKSAGRCRAQKDAERAGLVASSRRGGALRSRDRPRRAGSRRARPW